MKYIENKCAHSAGKQRLGSALSAASSKLGQVRESGERRQAQGVGVNTDKWPETAKCAFQGPRREQGYQRANIGFCLSPEGVACLLNELADFRAER